MSRCQFPLPFPTGVFWSLLIILREFGSHLLNIWYVTRSQNTTCLKKIRFCESKLLDVWHSFTTGCAFPINSECVFFIRSVNGSDSVFVSWNWRKSRSHNNKICCFEKKHEMDRFRPIYIKFHLFIYTSTEIANEKISAT